MFMVIRGNGGVNLGDNTVSPFNGDQKPIRIFIDEELTWVNYKLIIALDKADVNHVHFVRRGGGSLININDSRTTMSVLGRRQWYTSVDSYCYYWVGVKKSLPGDPLLSWLNICRYIVDVTIFKFILLGNSIAFQFPPFACNHLQIQDIQTYSKNAFWFRIFLMWGALLIWIVPQGVNVSIRRIQFPIGLRTHLYVCCSYAGWDWIRTTYMTSQLVT